MGKTDNYFGGIYISLITYNHIVDSRSVLNIAGSIMEPDGADTVTCRATGCTHPNSSARDPTCTSKVLCCCVGNNSLAA